MGLVSSQEDTRELSLFLCYVRTQQKLTMYKQERELRTQPCLHPDLELPAFRTVRNKCLLLKLPPSPSLWYCVLSAPADKDTGGPGQRDVDGLLGVGRGHADARVHGTVR